MAVDYSAEVKRAIDGQAGDHHPGRPVREFSAIFRKGEQSIPLQFTGGELSALDTIYGPSDLTVTL